MQSHLCIPDSHFLPVLYDCNNNISTNYNSCIKLPYIIYTHYIDSLHILHHNTLTATNPFSLVVITVNFSPFLSSCYQSFLSFQGYSIALITFCLLAALVVMGCHIFMKITIIVLLC